MATAAKDNTRVRLIVRGRVQGVFFRASTCEQARRYQVCGWIRNLVDGGVEIVAEGDRRSVQELIAWCHQGPAGARVTQVKVTEEPHAAEFRTFDVRY